MKNELLEKFKKSNFDSLTKEQKEDLIVETIRTIQKEQGLSELDIKLEAGQFGLDHKNKTILIDLADDIDSYTILMGIIHEVRHQYQTEKLDFPEMPYSKRVYILDPKEIDAHEYAISEINKYADFFNEDDFDIYVLKLRNQFESRKNHDINIFKSMGYEEKDIDEIARRIAEFDRKSVLISEEEADPEKDEIIEEGGIEFDDGTRGLYKKSFNNNVNIAIPGIGINIIGNDIYVLNLNVREIKTRDFVMWLQNFIEELKKDTILGHDSEFKNVYFTPAVTGVRAIGKNEYEAFLASLGCKDGRLDISDGVILKNVDEDHILKNTIPALPHDGMELEFGIEYCQKYTKEQVEILKEAKNFEIELEELEQNGENKEGAFVAYYQYRPEYTPKKMRLILEGQKHGLNTTYYDDLDEEQIEQLMKLQLEGAERKDWIDIIKKGLEIPDAKISAEDVKGAVETVREEEYTKGLRDIEESQHQNGNSILK